MKKKMLSLVLAGAMTAALLTGCGSTGADSTSTADGTTNEAAAEDAGADNADAATDNADASDAATDAAEDTGAAAGANGTFKIGGIGPLTGGAAVYGIAAMNGSQIAVDEINAAGGINGMTVELNFQDDELDSEKSVNAYNTLKDWGVQVIDGCVTSACSIAVAAKTAEDNIFQLTPSGSAVECVTNPNSFRVCFSDPNQGAASAQYIGEHNLATKIAVIYDSSDVYSSGIYEKFVSEAANQSFEIVTAGAFTADNKTDFSVQLQQAKDAGADLVFLPIYYNEAALILKQASDMGFDVQFFGCDGLDGILGVDNFDASLAEGVMLLTPFAADATDDLTVKFVTTYNEKFGETPNQFAADGYDAIYTIKAAAEKAGITADMSNEEICTALSAAMTEIQVDGLTGLGITWDASGEPTKEPKAVVIKDGVYTAM
ncbi:MAG: ABC transporter substrate-binding protein [Lachnospiraceae bacterium]|nr:ABC transporter substrate-binding protein [Lachnospiraceae bacterium]